MSIPEAGLRFLPACLFVLIVGAHALFKAISQTVLLSKLHKVCPTASITAAAALPRLDIRRRGNGPTCGYCCGSITISCDEGAYCAATTILETVPPPPGRGQTKWDTETSSFRYCSTPSHTSQRVYTDILDYQTQSSPDFTCPKPTLCCANPLESGQQMSVMSVGTATHLSVAGC